MGTSTANHALLGFRALGETSVPEWLSGLTRAKATRAHRNQCLRQCGRNDLQQELLTAVLEAAPSYDPDRGQPSSFAACVCDTTIKDLLRREMAQRRGSGSVEVHSLDNLNSPASLRTSPDDIDRLDTQFDVREALDQCRQSLREIGLSIGLVGEKETAKRFNLTRGQLRGLKRELRREFEDAGLRVYL